jgi:hypothetical protein
MAAIDSLVDDLGRLRRLLDADPESYTADLLERIARNVETLWSIANPTAAELYAVYVGICGDEELAAAEALRVTDQATRDLHCRMNRKGGGGMTADDKKRLLRSARSWLNTTGRTLEWREVEPRLKEAFERAGYVPTFVQRQDLYEWWAALHFDGMASGV